MTWGKEYRNWWTCRYQSSWLNLAGLDSPLSSQMPDLNRGWRKWRESDKGCNSYSTFQISCLPRLEEHIAWAAVALLTLSFPICYSPFSFLLALAEFYFVWRWSQNWLHTLLLSSEIKEFSEPVLFVCFSFVILMCIS